MRTEPHLFNRVSVIAAILITALPFPWLAAENEKFFTPEQDKKGLKQDIPMDGQLPNVLILGDSISIAYTPFVRRELEGKANVIRPNANCGDTRAGIANIEAWLGKTKWDVIHFNWGLHDLCYRNPEAKTQGNRDKKNGILSVPLNDYEANLEKLVLRLKETGAKLIWASTTFVPEGEAGRFVGDDDKYNAAAAKVMEKHGVLTNDLHSITKAFPAERFVRPGDVHYTQEGSAELGREVAVSITTALENMTAHELIDTHVHLWQLDRPAGISWIKKDDQVLYRDVLPDFHEPIAAQNGVTGVVLVQAGQSIPDNQWNLDVSAHNPGLYRGVVGNLSEIIGTEAFATTFKELCKDPRYLGYRLSGRYRENLDEAFYRDLELTAAAGKSVDFLVDKYSLADVAEIAQRVPKLRIIIDHFGNIRLTDKPLDPDWAKAFREVAKQPNVYCKVSALYGRVQVQPAPKELAFYQPIIDLAFEAFGEDRLVYGSDWPVTEKTGDYASVLKLTREYFDRKGARVSKKLFSENAKRFYAIPEAK